MGSTRIMIVENNAMVAEDCRDCLESSGYIVTAIVASGEESITKAETDRPDAVLMDIRLRDEMDGIEAAETIHARFGIPVVILSAYSDRDLLERAKRSGSFGYLLKPFNERELYATLEMALYKSKAEKARRRMEARLRQSQKMEAVGMLAGGIAHQFNNALSVVTGNIDLLEMDYPGDKNIADYVKVLRTSAQRMAQLTAQLVAYARGGKYETETISLADFIETAIPIIKTAVDPAIHIDTELPHHVLNVEVDQTQMQAVLSAIVTNSSEAMPGRGRVRITCTEETISKRITRDFPGFKPGDYACLTITDDGSGMDEETRARVFEPFFTTKFEGRGLGMAAAYGFVKSHGGYIVVNSVLGKGTTVKIYLPVIV